MAKPGMSNVWTGISENTKLLCEGIRVAVGNGSKNSFGIIIGFLMSHLFNL